MLICIKVNVLSVPVGVFLLYKMSVAIDSGDFCEDSSYGDVSLCYCLPVIYTV